MLHGDIDGHGIKVTKLHIDDALRFVFPELI